MIRRFVLALAIIGGAFAQTATLQTNFAVFPTRTIALDGPQGGATCACTELATPTCVGGSRNGQPCGKVQPVTTGFCSGYPNIVCPATAPGGQDCTAANTGALTAVPCVPQVGWGTCTTTDCECPPTPQTGVVGPPNAGITTVCAPGTVQPPGATPTCVRAGVCTARWVEPNEPYGVAMFCDSGDRAGLPCTNPNPNCPNAQATEAGVSSCVSSYPTCTGGANAGQRCDITNTGFASSGNPPVNQVYFDCPGARMQPQPPFGATGANIITPLGMCDRGTYRWSFGAGGQQCDTTTATIGATVCTGGQGTGACMNPTGTNAGIVCRPPMGICNTGSGTNAGATCPGTYRGTVIPGGTNCAVGTGQSAAQLLATPPSCVLTPRLSSSPPNPCRGKSQTAYFAAGAVGTVCTFDEKCSTENVNNATLTSCIPKDNTACVRYTTLGKSGSDGAGAGMDMTQAPKGCRSTEKCCDGNCCSWNQGCMTQESGPFFYNFKTLMAEAVARNDWKLPEGTEIKNKPRQCMNENTWMNATAGLKVILLPVFGILLTAFCFMQANKNKTGEMGENMGPMLMIFFSFWLVFSYHIVVALFSILVATATMVASPAWTSWVLFFQILFFWWTVGGSSFFLPNGTLYGGNFITDMVSGGPTEVSTMATNCATYFNFFMYTGTPQGSSAVGNIKYMSNMARTTWGYCSLEFVSFGATFAVFSVLAYFATIVQTTIRCLTSGDSSRASQALTAAKV